MKKILTLIIIVFCATTLFAQAPEKFSYQAVVRNASNQLVANAPVGVRISLLQGGVSGTLVYMETQTSPTNANGLMTLSIGGGTLLHGDFASIDWANGPYFLKAEIDPTGGTDYSVTSTQQLLSVPYALYSKEAGNGFSGDYNDLTNKPELFSGDYNDLVNPPTIPTVPTNVSAFNNDAGYITMDSVPAIPTNVSSFTNDAGYITSYTETDPTVPAWAKEPNKPAYDYTEIANTPTIPTVPTNVSAFMNDAGYITQADVPAIPSVPENVSAFTNDANYITAEGIPVQVNADWEATDGVAFILNKPEIPIVPENVSTFANDAGYLTNADLLAVINTLNARIDSLQNQLSNSGNSGDTTSYHDDFDFAQLPTVVTIDTISELTQTSVFIPIMFVDDGGGVMRCIGVCYDTTATPTVANSHVDDEVIVHYTPITYPIVGLVPGKTYYARAYATNNKGTAYGETISFTTPIANQEYGIPCSNTPIVMDIDGNVYNTVQIGNQCWMRENLRTTKSPSGKEIKLGIDRFMPGNLDLVRMVGYMYSPIAIMDGAAYSYSAPSEVQGICPNGWHIPSIAEWDSLFSYVRGQAEWQCSGHVGKALTAATMWLSSTTDCAIGNDIMSNNKSGFSVLPMDVRKGYMNLATSGEYIIPTPFGSENEGHCSVLFSYNQNDIEWNGGITKIMVRCLRDYNNPPVVVLNKVVKQTTNSLKVTSEVIYGGTGLTSCGVCWSTEENPTVADSHTTQSGVVGTFETEIAGLTPGITYYIRSYATNTVGTAYSNQKAYYFSASDNIPCPNAATVTDIDNNVYNTVQIGNQCWMRENLKTTRYADGTTIDAVGFSYSNTQAYRYYPNYDSSNVSQYGFLYNWKAVMGNFSSSNSNPSEVQGICPTGWHVPSDAEWTELTDYVSNQSQYVCGDSSINIAKALAATTGWLADEGVCTVGNNPNANNSTGFTAIPAGYFNGSSYQRFEQFAEFWSSTQIEGYNSNKAWYRDLDYRYPDVDRASPSTIMGLSVRCLRD